MQYGLFSVVLIQNILEISQNDHQWSSPFSVSSHIATAEVSSAVAKQSVGTAQSCRELGCEQDPNNKRCAPLSTPLYNLRNLRLNISMYK